MRLFIVYRTKKGNLTLKLQPEVAYSVYARSKANALEMLDKLKKMEKDNGISEGL